METGINHIIFISAVLLGIGMYILITAKEAIRVIIGLSVLFSASILNISAFSGFWNFNTEGQITIFLVTAICVMNISAGLLLFIIHYKTFKTNLFDEVSSIE